MKTAVLPFGPVGVTVACLCLAANAYGAGEIVPDIRITVESNDNPALRTDAESSALAGSATRLVAEARFLGTLFSQRSEVSIEPAVRSDAYTKSIHDELESTDLFLRSGGQWRWPRWNFGFDFDIDRERILGTNFLDAEPGEIDLPGDVDGVLLGQNEERTRFIFGPFTQIDLGQRSQVRMDLRAMDVSYDDQPLLRVRTDFTDWEAGFAYFRVASPRTTYGVRLYGGRYEADRLSNVTDDLGLEMRVEHALSQLWSVTAAFGVERNEYTYLDDSGFFFIAGSDDNAAFDIDVRKRSERTLFDIGVSRRSRPDSFGSVVLRSELSAGLQRDFSQTVRGGLIVRAIDSDAISVAQSDREFGRLELNLRWALSESWALLAGYERSYWRNVTADSSANSNSVVLGLNYRGRSQRVQR